MLVRKPTELLRRTSTLLAVLASVQKVFDPSSEVFLEVHIRTEEQYYTCTYKIPEEKITTFASAAMNPFPEGEPLAACRNYY